MLKLFLVFELFSQRKLSVSLQSSLHTFPRYLSVFREFKIPLIGQTLEHLYENFWFQIILTDIFWHKHAKFAVCISIKPKIQFIITLRTVHRKSRICKKRKGFKTTFEKIIEEFIIVRTRNLNIVKNNVLVSLNVK